MAHKSYDQLYEEIDLAKTLVEVGSKYAHFKNPDKYYVVKGFAFTEANDEVCVLYASQDNLDIVFVRPVSSWIQEVEHEGSMVKRFKKV